jgi:GNAT superfamily N-acetyltransferase
MYYIFRHVSQSESDSARRLLSAGLSSVVVVFRNAQSWSPFLVSPMPLRVVVLGRYGVSTMLRLREAAERDFAAIARLHAESWRSAYRGMLSDEYLDHRVHLERATLWQQRFSERAEKPFFVILAEVEEELAGFACVFPDEDPTYGAFLDNLHVVPQRTGQGIGRRLLSAVAERLLTDERRGGLYLWVIEQNARARQFYAKAGALEVECAELSMPDGSRQKEMRCFWPSAARLLASNTTETVQ